jgi:hypothetical protein
VQQPQAGLEVRASISGWLAALTLFTLYLFSPKISIDGSQPMPAKWGDNLVPMTPGRHLISFWWPLYWVIPASRAQLVVDIQPGQVAQLLYQPRWIWFLEGRMQQVGVRPMQVGAAGAIAGSAAQPAAWHPDPAGRHELRYWNGTAWTDDVSDGGVTTKDPAGTTG